MTLEHRLAVAFLTEHPAQAALVLEQLPLEARVSALQAAPVAAAPALREMTPAAAAAALAHLPHDDASAAVAALPTDVAATLLRRLAPGDAASIVATLPAERQHLLRLSLRYEPGTAGALMDPAVLALPDDITTADARVRLRQESRDLLHYLYVVDRMQHLVGVLGIPELLRARGGATLRTMMRHEVQRLTVSTPAAAIRTHPAWQSFHALPVVDAENRLVGAIRYQTLRRLEREADTRRTEQPASVTIAAMGELFHLGLAGFVEGVAAVSAPRVLPRRPAVGPAGPGGETS